MKKSVSVKTGLFYSNGNADFKNIGFFSREEQKKISDKGDHMNNHSEAIATTLGLPVQIKPH